MVLTLVFRSVIHFELILYVVRLETHFTLLYAHMQLSQNHRKDHAFLVELLWHACQKSTDHKFKGINTHFDKEIFIEKIKFYLKCSSLMR